MMSSMMNMHPPQTYSRLFRPWDTNKNKPTCGNEKPLAAVIKTERCSPNPAAAIKAERGNGNDSERECTSSVSSSSKCSYEEELPQSSQRPDQSLSLIAAGHSPRNESPIAAATVFNAPHFCGAFESHQQLQMLSGASSSSSELYYAAATAAAVNGILPPAHAASSFGMDPYTLGLMEQEYARVMAEDAHLKAINARKQRPKKFKCPHCDVAFSNNGQLKGHIRIHTGERPFKCDVETCGKTFTRNEELTRHKRIHSGLRPYPCTACGKKFGRRDHLKKHMKTHMPQERQLGPAIFVPMYPYLYGY